MVGNKLEGVKTAYEELYNVWKIQYKFREKVYGGIPNRLETAMLMIEARVKQGKIPPEMAEQIKKECRERFEEMYKAMSVEVEGEVKQNPMEEAVKMQWTTFWQDDQGVYLESRTLKSALRECLSILNVFTTKHGTKSGHNFGFYVEPSRLYLKRDGVVVKKPDGYDDRPVIIQDAGGKRTAIKRVDFVEGACIDATIKIIPGRLEERHIVAALALLQDLGHGAMRSQGFGQLDMMVAELLEEVDPMFVSRETKAKK